MFTSTSDRIKLLSVSLAILADSSSATTAQPWAVLTSECAPGVPEPLQPHSRFGCPRPVDEIEMLGPTSWSPWTNRPSCVNGTSDLGTPIKYCTFTNSRHGYDGMSIITRPETAARSLHLLDEWLPTVYRERIRTKNGTTDPPYKIVDIPGKGKGVIATRRIARYETIMVDYAHLLIDIDFPVVVRREEGYEMLLKATAQLPNPNSVLGLGRSNPWAGNPVEDVLRTNAFHTPLADSDHMALYPDVAVE